MCTAPPIYELRFRLTPLAPPFQWISDLMTAATWVARPPCRLWSKATDATPERQGKPRRRALIPARDGRLSAGAAPRALPVGSAARNSKFRRRKGLIQAASGFGVPIPVRHSPTSLNRYRRSARSPPPRRRCGHSGKGDQQDRPAHSIGRGVDGSDRGEDCLDLILEPIINAVFVVFSRRREVRRIDRTEFRLGV